MQKAPRRTDHKLRTMQEKHKSCSESRAHTCKDLHANANPDSSQRFLNRVQVIHVSDSRFMSAILDSCQRFSCQRFLYLHSHPEILNSSHSHFVRDFMSTILDSCQRFSIHVTDSLDVHVGDSHLVIFKIDKDTTHMHNAHSMLNRQSAVYIEQPGL